MSQSHQEDGHVQDDGTVQDDEVTTPHLPIVVVPDMSRSPVRALKLQDAVREQRERKRPPHLADFTNPDTERIIKRTCKAMSSNDFDPLKGPDAKHLKDLRCWFDLRGKRQRKDVDCHTGTHGKRWFKELFKERVWLRDEVCYFTIMYAFRIISIFVSY